MLHSQEHKELDLDLNEVYSKGRIGITICVIMLILINIMICDSLRDSAGIKTNLLGDGFVNVLKNPVVNENSLNLTELIQDIKDVINKFKDLNEAVVFNVIESDKIMLFEKLSANGNKVIDEFHD